ncbi:MAG TPA: hypothetical protein VKS00_03935 [Candidatus Acidoferrales bacterium]|nr:hypothetical protein [Candidatus Acidoferrales bacterium]
MSFPRLCSRIAARLRIRTQYTRALEDEVARLRVENRALVNSILGVAGIPPMRMAAAANSPQYLSQLANTQSASVGETLGSPGRGKPRPYECEAADSEMSAHITPLRKRTWQQIERAREIEDARAARRERETDTETFPTPRNIVPRA